DYLALAQEIRKLTPSIEEVWVLGQSGAASTARFEELLAEPSVSGHRRLSELEPASGDVAVLQLSGGTTGVPKLISPTHGDYLYTPSASAAATSVYGESVVLLPIPLAHNFPLACPGLQGALLAGARVILCASPAPDAVFPAIERERVTWIPAVPATLI